MEERSDQLPIIQDLDSKTREDIGGELPKDIPPGGRSVTISNAQIIHTLYRIAKISAGLSWVHNVPRHYAGILSAHTLTVELCRLEINLDDKVQEIVKDCVEDGLNMYYNLYGMPLTRPKGKQEVEFVKKK